MTLLLALTQLSEGLNSLKSRFKADLFDLVFFAALVALVTFTISKCRSLKPLGDVVRVK